MKWKILGKSQNIIEYLVKSRNIEINPPPPKSELKATKAINRIKKAIGDGEKIIVYGDYDADGICATAIMWEALDKLGAKALPFIPSREKEGYGLSKEGIDQVDASLIITVDNGIVGHEAVDYANKKNIDVIIVDHHEKPKKLPKAYAIVHTEKLCAAGISHFLAQSLVPNHPSLELAAIATITDLMPLTGINRSIVKHGLKSLNESKRPGIKALVEVAGIKNIGTYEIGYIIGPRLNAAGRIESALTALRLLCTHNPQKAKEYAETLNATNKERQVLTKQLTLRATSYLPCRQAGVPRAEKIIVLEHEEYHQGVIGLIAGKLVEKYYLPAIVISKGEEISKASARSIAGFNIIEAIRSCSELLINAGGHPAAAGFTIKTSEISNFKFSISKYASEKITDDLLEKELKIDLEIPLNFITLELSDQLQQLAPFGIGNPEPVFASTSTLQNVRTVGAENKHLKLVVDGLDAIAFNLGHLAPQLKIGEPIRLAYSLALDTFNGNHKLQLKVRDIKI